MIATDRMGAALEFIQTGVNGWLIPASDESAILQAMRDAASLTTAELTQRSIHGARQRKGTHAETRVGKIRRFARETIGV